MPRAARLLLCAAVVALLPGCGSIVVSLAEAAAGRPEPWNGHVTVASDPPGAACTVGRDGRMMQEIEATPAAVPLPRSNFSLDVRCTAPERMATRALLRSEADRASFRMVPTGIVSLTASVVATANAANSRYPDAITVHLPPARFPDDASRDAWFQARAAAIRAERAPAFAAERATCSPQDRSVCEVGLMMLQNAEDEDLRILEAQRRVAVVAPVTAAE